MTANGTSMQARRGEVQTNAYLALRDYAKKNGQKVPEAFRELLGSFPLHTDIKPLIDKLMAASSTRQSFWPRIGTVAHTKLKAILSTARSVNKDAQLGDAMAIVIMHGVSEQPQAKEACGWQGCTGSCASEEAGCAEKTGADCAATGSCMSACGD